MKNELKLIISELRETIEESKLYGVSPETIFSESCSFLRGKLAGENRDKYNYQKQKIVEPRASNDEITPKQKAFLQKIGKFKEGTTKQEAFTIIQELSKKQKYKEY